MKPLKRGVFLVAFALFLAVFSLSASAQQSCFVYGPSLLYCNDLSKAEVDNECKNFADDGAACKAAKLSTACSELSECTKGYCAKEIKEVISACQSGAYKGQCEATTDGFFITDITSSEYKNFCQPGCCVAATQCINGISNWNACQQQAENFGGFVPGGWHEGKDCSAVLQCTSKEPLLGSVAGTVTGETGSPLAGAEIAVGKIIANADAEGKFTLENVPAGVQALKTNAAGYNEKTLSVVVEADKEVTVQITLQVISAAGPALSGKVTDAKTGKPIANALVKLVQGKNTYVAYSDNQGEYAIITPAGTYTLTASAQYYGVHMQDNIDMGTMQTQDISLTPLELAYLVGTVTDEDGNPVPYAQIHVMGKGLAAVANENGAYKTLFPLEEGEYEIKVTHWEYEEEKEIVAVDEEAVAQGQKVHDVTLAKATGECVPGQPDANKFVAAFTASHVPGKKAVQLDWQTPCPEVDGYRIERVGPDGSVNELSKDIGPAATAFIDADEALAWGESYTYTIFALYEDLEESGGVSAEITLGSAECESKAEEEEFCDASGRIRMACVGNILQELQNGNCETENGPNSWCAGPDVLGKTRCEDISICKVPNEEQKSALPFGMFYTKEQCVGDFDESAQTYENFCAYDFSKTIVNECRACGEDVQTCFDYRSQQACKENPCKPRGQDCQWVPTGKDTATDVGILVDSLTYPFTETGAGYCTPKEKPKETTFCGLCSPDITESVYEPLLSTLRVSTLFENAYCSAAVCSSLGQCYSDANELSCASCVEEETTCYDFVDETSCVGESEFVIDVDKTISSFSGGSCSFLQRCAWDDVKLKCFKDGNDDDKSDCTGNKDTAACRNDNQAPTTTVQPAGFLTISEGTPSVTFVAADPEENHIAAVSYCFGLASNGLACNDFVPVDYPILENEVDADLLSAFEGKVNGESHVLRYYSTDEYGNQESAKEKQVLVDNAAPEIELKVEKEEVSTTEFHMTATLLALNEKSQITCAVGLKKLLPAAAMIDTVDVADVEKQPREVIFSSLSWGRYNLSAACSDQSGNVHELSQLVEYENPDVHIIEPTVNALLGTNAITFKVETTFTAHCELLNSKGKVADFASDDGQVHETTSIEGFAHGVYLDYVAQCTGLLDPAKKEEGYFDFTVDFKGPDTAITFNDEVTYEISGWSLLFKNPPSVSFSCIEEGFACDKIISCFGEGCEPNETFTKPFVMNQTTTLRYYSIDVQGQQGSLFSGFVDVSGFGIELKEPKYGVSNTEEFSFVVTTKADTVLCKWDTKEAFDFNKTIAPQKIFTSVSNKEHKIGSFKLAQANMPFNIFVKCKSSEGELSPAKKFTLEYDPTAPTILEAKALPPLVVSGNAVELFVKTDDKTFCRYDDAQAENFDAMAYEFPGFGKIENLTAVHKVKYLLDSADDNRHFLFFVRCMNGAGNLSEAANLTFDVNFSIVGSIVSLKPSGAVKATNVTLEVQTSKEADFCIYENYADEMAGEFGTTDFITFTAPVSNLQEKAYSFFATCQLGPYFAEGVIAFTVDKTAPVISIHDGNVTCSLEETPDISVTAGNESAPLAYLSYELIEKATKKVIASGNASGAENFEIEDLNMSAGKTYVVKATAFDQAGNPSKTVESDGFVAQEADAEICKENYPPLLSMNVTPTTACNAHKVALACDDLETSCKNLTYGTAATKTGCAANKSYTASFTLDKTTWVCFSATDSAGNKAARTEEITFKDKDGDKVLDDCDMCKGTGAGSSVDVNGCAKDDPDNNVKDTDKDGLPDSWEKLHDDESCAFDPLDDDSDADGVTDDEEDYDGDGYTNKDEQKLGSDPCEADALDADGDGILDADDKCDDTPPSEIYSVSKDQSSAFYGCGPSEIGGPKLPPAEEEPPVLPWVLFFIGILLLLGGSGYLLVKMQQAKGKKPAVSMPFFEERAAEEPQLAHPFDFGQWHAERRLARELEKKHERKKIFEIFGGEGKEMPKAIPHVEKIMQKDLSPMEKLGQLAKKYAENRGEIESALHPHERTAFKRLEKFAGGEVRGKKARDAYKRLEKLVKEHRKGK